MDISALHFEWTASTTADAETGIDGPPSSPAGHLTYNDVLMSAK